MLRPSVAALHLLACSAAWAACPDGWVASTNSSFLYECYFLAPPNSNQFSVSLRRCVEVCAEHGAVPPCFSSSEEMAFVETAFSDSKYFCGACARIWTGVYRDTSISTAIDSWTKCVDGNTPFDIWGVCRSTPPPSDMGCSEVLTPDAFNYAEICGGMGGPDRGFRSQACHKFMSEMTPCLCAGPATTSAAFSADLEELEVAARRYQSQCQATVAQVFGATFAVTLLPSFVVFVMWLLSRCQRKTVAKGQRTEQTVGDRTEQRLRAAGEAAKRMRVRVSFTLLQIGFSLFIFGFTPSKLSLALARAR